jgi:hypothetical protein
MSQHYYNMDPVAPKEEVKVNCSQTEKADND